MIFDGSLRHYRGPRRTFRAATAAVSVAALLLSASLDPAAARTRHTSSIEVAPRAAGTPLMAVVALDRQRITIYDTDGWMLRAPVSSGQTGRETPAGIYSVLQKEVEHYSNLYDDASMPHMERLTWSGIALHGGPLPGYPASHGCVRMPYDFAERLFDLTKVGMRVIVAPSDAAPAPIVDDHLFKPRPVGTAAAGQPVTLRSIAAAKAAEAQAAARKAEAARTFANHMTWDIGRAQSILRLAGFALARADLQLRGAETALANAATPQASARAEEAKLSAQANVLDAQLRLDAAAVQADAKPDIASARAAAEAASAEQAAAAAAAREAAHQARPISVFVSRKTQHLYVRQAFEPVFDSPVTIRDADQPLGTHIFTALGYSNADTALRWNVVSMPGHSGGAVSSPRDRRHHEEAWTEPAPENTSLASAALDRIGIPQDALERVSQLVSPGSSLIISDEPQSQETGEGTDFVVLMSGEPQGGIKMRHHGSPEASARSEHRDADASSRYERRQYRGERTYPYSYRSYYYGGYGRYYGGYYGAYNRF